ncbi:Uncharacterized MFS-type transporter C09D4.1 [Eumeta japonica]|uniref:Uncharacterized MFS-type transporter C09D4.1 n=1 Tax=Eumeta variegata TaxID=151549 RepID=A0A4C1TDT1_EUMVA|nr:Uncharacterized MFS-type transporter C09D4.1 [Eumeta japonica]
MIRLGWLIGGSRAEKRIQMSKKRLDTSFINLAMGLRVTTIIGSLGTCAGAWLKVFSVPQHLFWVGFAGQTVVAVSQVFILNVPPRLAAVWFGADQVSSACSVGVFGNQVGGHYVTGEWLNGHDGSPVASRGHDVVVEPKGAGFYYDYGNFVAIRGLHEPDRARLYVSVHHYARTVRTNLRLDGLVGPESPRYGVTLASATERVIN